MPMSRGSLIVGAGGDPRPALIGLYGGRGCGGILKEAGTGIGERHPDDGGT